MNARVNPATGEPGPTATLTRLTARMRPLPIDQRLANDARDPDLARDWATFLDAPRALLVEGPETGMLVLFNALEGADQRTAEEMLLEVIMGGALRVFAVGEDRRVAEWRIEVHEPWDARAVVGTLAAARDAADLRVRLAAHAEPGPPRHNTRLEMRGYGLLEPGVAAATRWIDRLVQRAADAGAIREDEIDALSGSLVRRERWLRRQARQRIAALLDLEVVARLRRDLGEIDLRIHEWLREAAGDAARNRRQAIANYPAALTELLFRETENAAEDGGAPWLTAAIDAGEPLAPRLARAWDVGRRAVAILHGVKGGWIDEASVEPLLLLLRRVSPGHRPKFRGEWRACAALARAAWSVRTLFARDPVRFERAQAAMGRYFEACGRRGWQVSWRRFQAGFHHTRSLREAHDLVRSVRGLPPGTDRERVLDRMAEQALPGLQRLSERWHAALATAPVGTESPRAGLEWPGIAEGFEQGGVRTVPLTTPSELAAEGRALAHCAAGHGERCLFERVHVVSMRDTEGRCLATAEVAVARGKNGWKVSVVQHRGFRNGEPPLAAKVALHAFLLRLAAPDAHGRFDELEAERVERLARREEIEARLEAEDPGAVRIAFGAVFGIDRAAYGPR